MPEKNYDFGGWATKNNIRCADGRTIRRDAFKECDGEIVPLVWNHRYNDPANVLGHALLKNRSDGVYAYCCFNDTENGRIGKQLVEHGDITQLSIYANNLKHNGSEVVHGRIREVSLVHAGANPGARIESVIRHGDICEDEIDIFVDMEPDELSHSEELEVQEEKKEEEITHAEEPVKEEKDRGEKTVGDIIESMNDEQKAILYGLIGSNFTDDSEESEETNDEGEKEVKHNIFENEPEVKEYSNTLTHSQMETIVSDAKRMGSMRESFLAHAEEFGIKQAQIDWLFPDYKTLNTPPEFIKRDTGWVTKMMSTVHHTPFSRIKSMFADITEDEARARGYIKGKQKKDEVFTLIKRTTDPQTIYKRQRFERDDIIDISNNFDIIPWVKAEMRMMLDEEIARAVLVGDGRLSSSDDKIKQEHVRSIWQDEDFYTIKAVIKDTGSMSEDDKAKQFIRTILKSRKDYKGSGDPILFTTEDMLTDLLLLTDNNGRDLFDSEAKLATKLRVREIVTVPVMENQTREVSGKKRTLAAVIVNPRDYNIGADKGGSVAMFDDFDIDYNRQIYLIETRLSGALIRPYAAIAVEFESEGE